MKTNIIILIITLFLIGCQASGKGGSSDLVSGHIPAENKFTLTTALNRTYTVGETLNIVLTFPKDIQVSGGTPSINVTMGTIVKTLPMSTTTPRSMVFTYVIIPGDDDSDGISVSSNFAKNGATIKYNSNIETNTGILLPNLSTVLINTIGGTAPVASNISPAAFNEDTQSIITLSYTDVDGHLASSCSLSSLVKVTVTQPCACLAGACTVGVTGILNANGAASFQYKVVANTQSSNVATATLAITSVPDLPVANNITPPSFNEDTQSLITLSYTDGDNDLASACAIPATNNVTVTQPCACAAGVCRVGVTGTANYSGPASFNYTVTANGNISNSAIATLVITAVGDAPVAANITPLAFDEDTQSIITLAYSDAENDLATACAIASPTNVTITQPCACAAGNCTVGVRGTSNYFGSAGFNYTVTAGGQVSNSASATFSINSVDDAPVATDITPPAFDFNTQSIITLSYTDVELHPATICSVSGLANVSVTQACACASGVCTVGVTGSINYSGPASFNYTVTANTLISNTATASLTIDSSVNPPVATDISPPAFDEETQSIITLSYTDADSDLATVCTVSSLTNVTETQPCSCSAGSCTVGITGDNNFFGAASFDYTVTSNGDISNIATASLTINNIDDAPVANNITPPAFNEDALSIITLSYTDADSELASTCTISGTTNVNISQACACAAGVCTVGVSGTSGYSGPAGFSYTVTSNSVVSNIANATLTISNVADAPVANNLAPAAFDEDTISSITLSYTDEENDIATACAITSQVNVTVTSACACAAGTCTVGVRGTQDFNGAASFSYTVTANAQASNTAVANLTINPIDDAPIANGITPPDFNEDTQSIITLDYTDIDGQASACAISGESNVTVTQPCACAAGVCTVGITGLLDYYGPASFNYTVTSDSIVSNSASATFTIFEVTNPPVADDITPPAFDEDTQSIITLSYSDLDLDLASACTLSALNNVSVTQPCSCSAGTCTVGVTGVTNFNGSAGFSYTVTANAQVSNVASATFTINPVADAPVAVNITPPAFDEDTSSLITLTYTDAEGDLADSCAVTGLTNVSITSPCSCVLGTCSIEIKGDLNYSGIASFNYTVTANSQTSNSATASLTITGVDDAPVAVAITPTAATEDIQKIITLSYTDVENHLASSCTINAPANVTVTQGCACTAGTCTVGVTGTLNYSGTAGFNYTVTANGLTSNSVPTSFSITAVNDAPLIGAIGAQTTPRNTATAPIAFTITDVDSTLACNATRLSMTSSNTSVVTNASVAWGGSAPNCTATITPVANAIGTTNLTFTVNDGNGGTAPRTFSLTVTGVVLVWVNGSGTTISSYNFGSPGGNTTATVYLKNDGNIDSSTITLSESAGSSKITQTNSCTTLAAGSTCPVVLNWQNPGPGGLREKTFTATADGQAPTLYVSGTR